MPDHTLGQRAPDPSPAGPRRFPDWQTGPASDSALRHDVPPPLVPVLKHWISLASRYDDKVTQRVGLRLGIAPRFGGSREQFDFTAALREVGGDLDLLDVINAMLGTHRAPDWIDDPQNSELTAKYAALVTNLIESLEDGGSAYTVAEGGRQLVERVDPTVATAVEQTIATAPPSAATLLRDAWNQTYGLHPDPTAAYRDAVRAVEELACPMVLPRDEIRTLGKVITHLRQGGHKWAFTLVDRDGADTVEPLVVVLDRLWTGQVSRHGGGQNSRDQTAAEAEAAVHLAATLVHLLATDALTRRATS